VRDVRPDVQAPLGIYSILPLFYMISNCVYPGAPVGTQPAPAGIPRYLHKLIVLKTLVSVLHVLTARHNFEVNLEVRRYLHSTELCWCLELGEFFTGDRIDCQVYRLGIQPVRVHASADHHSVRC
jgi:hypothetical protein